MANGSFHLEKDIDTSISRTKETTARKKEVISWTGIRTQRLLPSRSSYNQRDRNNSCLQSALEKKVKTSISYTKLHAYLALTRKWAEGLCSGPVEECNGPMTSFVNSPISLVQRKKDFETPKKRDQFRWLRICCEAKDALHIRNRQRSDRYNDDW